MKYNTNIFKETEVAYLDRQEPEKLRSLAQIYWRVLLLGGVLTAVAFLAYGGLMLAAVTAPLAGESAPGDVKASVGVDRPALDAILASYAARDARYKEISASPPNVADPSLKR